MASLGSDNPQGLIFRRPLLHKSRRVASDQHLRRNNLRKSQLVSLHPELRDHLARGTGENHGARVTDV